jgi:LytS/YehU family sensor histidine kinase
MNSAPALSITSRISHWLKLMILASLFGIAALVVLRAGLTLPIPGTNVVMDPREVFVTIGSALTGPFGGIVCGLLAGVGVPGGMASASILAHVSGGLWMGVGYKVLVYERQKMPAMLFGWAGLILVYYFFILMPAFILGLKLLYRQPIVFTEMYLRLATGALPEVIVTLLATCLVLLVMPKIIRRPLW